MPENLNRNKQSEANVEVSSKRGLVIVYTGSGKGKTTAALGLALRAVGHGHKVLILQFIKGTWKVGELEAIKKLNLVPFVEIEQLGLGFIEFKDGRPVVTEEQKTNAYCSFKYACDKIKSGLYDIIVLDEINNLVDYGLLNVEDV
ncbi:MAG: cob(I)yrinic acid a,c-diamide adenosyltransferase, partial [Actinobacteria bacterium]|nr:cob(I)yrinic acid a,c-diamide adenosyltransferase [Actinomycetota bacterium]